MGFTTLVLLALAMSTDAFAAAIARGAAMARPTWMIALRTGLMFGVIEAITPAIGWALGSVAANWIQDWDHWIAFVLLLVLGIRMILAGFSAEPEADQSISDQSFSGVILTAIATSIDAMAVGVGLAFVDVSILQASVMIGIATFAMVTLGVMLGRVLSSVIGRRAEALGGLVLVCVGAAILYEHLTM